MLGSWSVAGRTAGSRVLLGPHETNLGVGRALSAAHVEHYRRRAVGGAGVVVVETASVHDSDWPYERAPLATECVPGWAAVRAACRPHGTLVLAGLGHTGLQGSSAHSQSVLWGPSRFADPRTREQPMAMGPDELRALVAGFGAAARGAVAADLDGVEVDAGARSLLRQLHSPLTNTREDAYGRDRLRLTREVLAAVRAELGFGRVLALRLSGDELAPWGGLGPDDAVAMVAELAPLVDLLVVVRGGPYSSGAYRPDAHTPAGFNRPLCGRVRTAAGGVPVVLQGSVVSVAVAQAALDDGVCDAVEMTRALIADASLVQTARAGRAPRPCVLCNQECLVREDRNPLVSCVGDPAGYAVVPGVGDVLVVGGGPAGLEAARVAAERGFTVRLVERSPRLGGRVRSAAVAQPGLAALVDWLEAECHRLGVSVVTGRGASPAELGGKGVVLATGSRPRPLPWPSRPGLTVLDGAAVLDGVLLPPGPLVLHDPVGGPVAVALAEHLAAAGRQVTVVTPDPVVGSRLARTGDLADANGRLQRAGVARELLAVVHAVGHSVVTLEHRFTGARHDLPCAALLDCGHRLAQDALALAHPDLPRVGDCVAPRTIAEAVREGRAAALAL